MTPLTWKSLLQTLPTERFGNQEWVPTCKPSNFFRGTEPGLGVGALTLH